MAEYMGFEGLGKSQRIGVRGAASLAEEHGYEYEMLDNGKIKIFTPDGSRTFGPNVKAGSVGKFFGYAKGGAVPMKEQMELFEDGGLMQEGGTTDPVSGNDVPVGSTQEEVRDDIPAQLSEGEFVFPADVVRFYGLEKLMEMRQNAKAGLQRMEEMGQMGNSEEATLPDDIPFDIEDLDIDEENEYNNQLEMAEGGVVKAQAGTFVQPQGFVPQVQPSFLADYSQPQPVQPAFQMPTYKQAPVGGYVPQFVSSTPTTETTEVPSFSQLIPAAGGQQETKEYRNEAGQSLFIPFINDQPVYPIPEGYTEYVAEEEVTDVTTTPTQVQTTTVRDGGGRDDNVLVGGVTPAQIQQGISERKDRYAITGSRGFDLLQALPLGNVIKNIFDIEGPRLGAKKPDELGVSQRRDMVRMDYEKVLGTPITGYVGYEKGDLDPVTGGVFSKYGVATDEKGFATLDSNGNASYSAFSDFRDVLSAGSETGWRGGILSEDRYNNLSDVGKANYSKFEKALEAKQDKPSEDTSKPDTSKPSGPSAPASQGGGGSGPPDKGQGGRTGEGLDSTGRADI